MWVDFIKHTVLRPGLERLGTIAATVLVAGGDKLCQSVGACGLVTGDGATAAVTWVIAAALVAFDFAVIAINRKGKR